MHNQIVDLDHHYYENRRFGAFQPGQGVYSTSLMIPANPTPMPVTFSWDTNHDGYYNFEHLLIHNDIVRTYGSDDTGALGEAFASYVTPAPNATELTVINSYSKKIVPINQATPAPPPTSNQMCPTGPLFGRQARTFVVRPLPPGFPIHVAN